MKIDKDLVVLVEEFLQGQLTHLRERDAWGYDLEQQEEMETDEFLCEAAIEIVQSVLNEMGGV